MDDDFNFEFLVLLTVAESQKRLQDEFICILGARFPPLAGLRGVEVARHIRGEQSDISKRGVDKDIMILLLKNAAESLDKDNPFPTFEVTGTLTDDDFYYDDEETIKYGSGFYVFQTTETTSQRTYISLAYCAVEEAKMVYRDISLNADSDNKHKLTEFRWEGMAWGGAEHTHRVSFLGTSCAPLRLGIINWTTI